MRATPDSLARTWFRRPPFRSPLLWGCFLFLRVLRCFSSPTYLPRVRVPVHHHRGVAPFGDDGLTGCLRLPHPFAAGPRPSSAGRAEASSNRASCLAWSWITRQSRAPPTTRLARFAPAGAIPIQVAGHAVNANAWDKDLKKYQSHLMQLLRYERSGNAKPCPLTCASCAASSSSGTAAVWVEPHPTAPWFPWGFTAVGDCERAKLPRKEVIQPHLPVRLPCYDFVPVARPTLGRCLHNRLRSAHGLQVFPTPMT